MVQIVERVLPKHMFSGVDHIFSVLSFFFDCRDDGACRYRWEEELLKYFGAGVTEEGAFADFHKFEFAAADAAKPDYEYYNQPWFQMCFFTFFHFHKFEFAAADAAKPDYEYYNQPWFQMCFFLEHNFRNAIAGLHYKLFEAGAPVGYLPEHQTVPCQKSITAAQAGNWWGRPKWCTAELGLLPGRHDAWP
jgi:hypothetical protein